MNISSSELPYYVIYKVSGDLVYSMVYNTSHLGCMYLPGQSFCFPASASVRLYSARTWRCLYCSQASESLFLSLLHTHQPKHNPVTLCGYQSQVIY